MTGSANCDAVSEGEEIFLKDFGNSDFWSESFACRELM
jgi:hypothetical protein